MLSGRNNTTVCGTTMREVRAAVAAALRDVTWAGVGAFEPIYDRHETPDAGNWWDRSLALARECDIFLGFLTGEAGSPVGDGAIGICAEEWITAETSGPHKVFGLRFPDVEAPAEPAEARRNDEFRALLKRTHAWVQPVAGDARLEDVVQQALEIVAAAVTALVPVGARADRRSAFARGEALDWSRLSFTERQTEMLSALARYVGGSVGRADVAGSVLCETEASFVGEPVLAWLHAIPSGFGVSAARERIIRPLAREHTLAGELADRRIGGPVHIVAVHRAMTESQVAAFFGTPDLYVVSGAFGYYAADLTTLQQAFFLTQCRDSPAIAHALVQLTSWLAEVGEDSRVVALALQRARVVRLIAELRGTRGPRRPRRKAQRVVGP